MKIITLALAGASALTLMASAGAASAQGWTSIDARQAQLDQQIDAGIRMGGLTREEAMRLRGEFREIAQLESRYRADGLSNWERQDLDARFDRLAAQIHNERADNDHRGDGYAD